MSELKATPGPYIREKTSIYVLEHRGDYHKDGSPFLVNRFQAHVSGAGKDRGATDEELEAIAQLFAASPDLYEATEAFDQFHLFRDMASYKPDTHEVLIRVDLGSLRALEAALKLARSET